MALYRNEALWCCGIDKADDWKIETRLMTVNQRPPALFNYGGVDLLLKASL
jgi:hypothetical protein